MLQVWGGPQARSTKDIDLLRTSTAAVTDVVAIARDCLRVDVEDDRLQFDVDGIQGKETRRNAKYNGARLRVRSFLGKAEIALQVDVGFGDVITPNPTPFAYPSLLELGEPKLVGTTPETAIAEKFEAMVTLDIANARVKDFFDIWLLSERREFSGTVLFDAIRATFTRRGTPLLSSVPIALTSSFYANPSKKGTVEVLCEEGPSSG